MENRREYYKTYIILKQETRGYSYSNKEASGYCKIDAYGDKAKIQVYVQDLKPIPKEKGYKLYLLANLPTGPRRVPIESFYVAERGKRDMKFNIERTNIGGSGLSVEQFEGAAILAEDTSSDNIAPLIGFKKEPFSWKIKKNDIQNIVEEKIELKEKEITEEIKELKKTEQIDEFKKVEEIQKTEEVEKIEKAEPVVSSETVEQSETDFFSYFTPDSYRNSPRSKTKKESYLSKMLSENIRMNPFERVNEYMEWYRISYEELPLILDYPWRWYSNPYILVGAKKYNHLLLGKNTQIDTYCLGVPDIYFPNVKDRAKVFGFNTFLCCRNTRPVPGEYGYWIMDLPL